YRRSPAMSSKVPPTSRTSTGWRMPSSRTDAVSEASDSSSKCFRGWRGLERTLLIGTSIKAVPPLSTTSVGIKAPRPLPNPLRRATTHLLGQLPVGDSPPGAGIEHDDGLAEGRGLRQAHGPGHDVPAHLVAEVGPDLAGHLIGQLG